MIRAIQRTRPELIAAYHSRDDPELVTTEVTLMRPGLATKDNLIKFDVQEEYDKCHIAEGSNRDSDKGMAMRLLEINQEEHSAGTASDYGALLQTMGHCFRLWGTASGCDSLAGQDGSDVNCDGQDEDYESEDEDVDLFNDSGPDY